MKTATLITKALQTGSLAWVEGQQCPHVNTLLLPETQLGRMVARAFQEQSALGWNVLFRGFWTTTWRQAQELSITNMRDRNFNNTGERWAAKAQLWYYDLFELIWGIRNEVEHGADIDTQRLIWLSKCERAIRSLYDKGEDLPFAEWHPFRELLEDLLMQTVLNQELWITKTGGYLEKAFKRAMARPSGQTAITSFFAQLHE